MRNPKWLVGKTIARVEMNPSPGEASGGGTAHRPEIWFTDGSHIWFVAEELEHGDGYGVEIGYTPSMRKARLAELPDSGGKNPCNPRPR